MPCKVTYHKYNHRNDSADVSEDIYKDSEQREVSVGSDLVPDDNESFVKDLDPELQEVYCCIVERVANDRDKSEGVGMVVEEMKTLKGEKVKIVFLILACRCEILKIEWRNLSKSCQLTTV